MSRIKWIIRGIALFVSVLLSGCSHSQAGESSAGNIGGYNHVAGQNINWFSVNGYHATLNGNGIALFVSVLLSGCSHSQAGESSAGNIRGYNHVAGQNVNWFSVNGYHATLNGNVCCVMIPDQWRPGMTAHIEWEVDPNADEKIPRLKMGVGFEPMALAQHEAKYQHFSADVPIPQYKESAGINVHFLPCHQVKIYAGIAGYGADVYSIKEPMNMQEPATCQK